MMMMTKKITMMECPQKSVIQCCLKLWVSPKLHEAPILQRVGGTKHWLNTSTIQPLLNWNQAFINCCKMATFKKALCLVTPS